MSRLSVAELRNLLVNEFEWSPQDAKKIKYKKALVEAVEESKNTAETPDETLLDNLQTAYEMAKNEYDEEDGQNSWATDESILDNLQVTKENIQTDKAYPDNYTVPTPSDPRWTDYVLGELTDDEKIKDKNNSNKEYPTTDGLRRLVENFVGVIVKSTTEICQTPSPDNERRATVIVHVGVFSHNLEYNDLLECSGAADVYSGNSAIPFSNHPVATAETKSEGRAYKRLLKIKVSTYEEIAGSLDNDFTNPPIMESANQFIKQDQINFVDTLSSRLNINVQKFIQHFLPNFHLSLNQLPYDESCGLLALLQQYQGEGKNALEIPEDIRGYNDNWQNHWYKQDKLITSNKGEKE